MTDPKEEPTQAKEAEKAEDEKKSETEDKEKTDEKEKADDKIMETDEKEKGDDDDKEEEEDVASKAKTTKKRKKDESAQAAQDEGDDKDDGKPTREKRVRKTADVFEPDNFLAADKSLRVVAGRGSKLFEIEPIKASIDKLSMHSPDLMMAHRLLYTRQGKPAKKEIKKNLHEFCGFLPKAAEGQDKKELEVLEEEAEAKMSVKAYKLTIPQIKKICDLFHVDRFKIESKDDLINALLDFLGSPSEDQLKGARKKAAAKSAASPKSSGSKEKKKKKSAASTERDDVVEDDDDEESDDDDAPLKEGGSPSDEALRKWVRAYVRCFNLQKATVKHAIATASDKFGVDVSKKKALLKELLTSEM